MHFAKLPSKAFLALSIATGKCPTGSSAPQGVVRFQEDVCHSPVLSAQLSKDFSAGVANTLGLLVLKEKAVCIQFHFHMVAFSLKSLLSRDRPLLASFYYQNLLFWVNLESSSSSGMGFLVHHVNITVLDMSLILWLLSLLVIQARFFWVASRGRECQKQQVDKASQPDDSFVKSPEHRNKSLIFQVPKFHFA